MPPALAIFFFLNLKKQLNSQVWDSTRARSLSLFKCAFVICLFRIKTPYLSWIRGVRLCARAHSLSLFWWGCRCVFFFCFSICLSHGLSLSLSVSPLVLCVRVCVCVSLSSLCQSYISKLSQSWKDAVLWIFRALLRTSLALLRILVLFCGYLLLLCGDVWLFCDRVRIERCNTRKNSECTIQIWGGYD